MTMRTGQGPLTDEALAAWYAPPGEGTDDGTEDGTDEDRTRSWVRASFVTSLDGRVTGPGGLSGGLNEGSKGDHAVFGLLRGWADVVVVGAGTARAEGYEPLRGTGLVVVARPEDLPLGVREATEGEGEVVVLTGQDEDVSPEHVLELASERGWRRILVEGGPHLFGAWLQGEHIDELCLTVRPVLQGGDGPLLVPAEVSVDGLPGRATHALAWDGDLLLRVRLR